MKDISIIIPVFNDWMSVDRLIQQISRLPESTTSSFHIVIVDDFSTNDFTETNFQDYSPSISLTVIRLKCNVGHQKAICVGLHYVQNFLDVDGTLIMDSDGEDDPAGIPVLLEAAQQNQDSVICARRGKRSESVLFRVSYIFYKLVFRLLTGREIDFGNFMFLPRHSIPTVLHSSGAWNHVAASIVRSRLSTFKVTLNRSSRYFGQTKMNWSDLLIHALNAVSVYTDTALARIIFTSLMILLGVMSGTIFVLYVRFFTDYALIGWASIMFGFLAVIMLLGLLLASLMSIQFVYQSRSMTTIPEKEAPIFVANVVDVY